jgi:hypothetical protein
MHAPIARPQSENCIYLNHTGGNHYEVVTCVQHRNAASVCAGTCQPTNTDNNLRSLRKRKSEAEPENMKAKKERQRYHNDSDYRKWNVDDSKARYKTNDRFQTLVRKYSKAKYKTNSSFQTLVRKYSKAKYKTLLCANTRKLNISQIRSSRLKFVDTVIRNTRETLHFRTN